MNINTRFQTTTLGYPRVGRGRAYKWMLENYWSGKITVTELQAQADAREAECWQVQHDSGIDLIPCGDFSLYDHVLDTSVLLGGIPERYGWKGGEITPDLYFAMARGKDGVSACEMTKWFDTNYHYLVPELPERFQLTANSPLTTLKRAHYHSGAAVKPWLLGPFTFLRLAGLTGTELIERLHELTPLYEQILSELNAIGPRMVQVDEPALVGDVAEDEWQAFATCYQTLSATRAPLCLQTYYGNVAPLWPHLLELPVATLGIDLVAGRERNLSALKAQPFPNDKQLVLGIVDGRNVWRSDLETTLSIVEEVAALVPAERLWLSPSCSLLHLPETVADEAQLPAQLRSGLCFACERLQELSLLSRVLRDGIDAHKTAWLEARAQRECWLQMPGRNVPQVRQRVAHLQAADFQRAPLHERITQQRERLSLPLLPTTTIGSFPQTRELRQARALANQNQSDGDAPSYEQIIRDEIKRVICLQEEIGLDVLVHGEPERNDMVQFFAEQLPGYAATQQGWVQSYGSRCVRPPLVFGDVWRDQPMTVEISRYAQSLTSRPVKGMLTGPVTMMQWSFVRDDLPRHEVAYQIALAIRDEAVALEQDAQLSIIQIDEPAFREGLPLRRADWEYYLEWAVAAFRLSSAGVKPHTQIHTHMCYAEFSDTLEAIAALDADVLSIEDARSYGEMLESLREFRYPAGIGPGVYDIHSPNAPDIEEMAAKIRRTLERIPIKQVWVNPDCGLKTRGYEETIPALRHMVAAARMVREELLDWTPKRQLKTAVSEVSASS